MIKGQTLRYSKNIGRRFFGHVVQSAYIDKYGDRRYRSICDCGNEFTAGNRDVDRKLSCGCARTKIEHQRLKLIGIHQPSFELISARPNEHGIKIIHPKKHRKDGYVELYLPNHPTADNRGYIHEHRFMMEIRLGRTLLPGESVHHKNTVRHDNQDSNLELWTIPQRKGGRVSDLLEWAINFIQIYEPGFINLSIDQIQDRLKRYQANPAIDPKPSIAIENHHEPYF